jgi:hypothetical protein
MGGDMALGDISATPTEEGSEYGGVDGLIQPQPHEPTPSERRMLLTRSGPAEDPGSGSDVITEAAGPGGGVKGLNS